MSKTLTDRQVKNYVKLLNEYAKEPGRIEFFDGAIWYFGTEVATLRLALKYRHSDKTSYGYSSNLDSFYFKLEI